MSEPVEHRKNSVWLSDEQIEIIAEKAAVKAVGKMTDHMILAVGHGVLTRFTWFIGLIVVGLSAFAYGKGWIR